MKKLNKKLNSLKKKNKIKILIIRLKPIGDTVLISPVFRNLKKLFPQSEINVVVYPSIKKILENNPYINKIIILKRTNTSKIMFYLKSLFKYYDIIIDFINNPTSTMIAFFTHSKIKIGNKNKRNFFYTVRIKNPKKEYSAIRCLKYLQPLGLKNFKDFMPEIFLSQKDILTAKNILNTLNLTTKNKIGIFASAKYQTRQYPTNNLILLSKLIVKYTQFQIIFLFGKDDNKTLSKLHKSLFNEKNIHFISPKINIGELASLIKEMDILITNDTGPKHIAIALNIPTLTIYGATDEKIWNPPDKKHFPIIRKNYPCAPCNKYICPKNLECLKELSANEVFKKLKELIKVLKL